MTTRYRRRRGTVWRDLGDRVVVLAPGTAEAVALQAGGALLWDALEEPGSVDELGAQLDAPEGWVATALERLLEAGVAEVEP